MADNILQKAIAQQYQWVGESAGRIGVIEAAARSIKLAEVLDGLEGYVSLETYGDLGIAISLYRQQGLSAAFEQTETNPLQIVARRLLPTVGILTKGFNDKQNELTLSTTVRGVAVKFAMSTPQSCTVEAVEEEVEVAEQVIPAHTEKKVRYVLKGDCAPLMAAGSVAPGEVAAVGSTAAAAAAEEVAL